jgi:hypothetical protein
MAVASSLGPVIFSFIFCLPWHLCETTQPQRWGSCYRQSYSERCSLRAGFSHIDLPLVILNDAVTDGKPQPRALAHLFGGIKRIEDMFQGFLEHPAPGILNQDFNRFIFIA